MSETRSQEARADGAIRALNRRGDLHGIGLGRPEDPVNHSLVLPLDSRELAPLFALVARVAAQCPGLMVVPLNWVHTTLALTWGEDPGWRPRRSLPVTTTGSLNGGVLELTPYGLRLAFDDPSALNLVAQQFGLPAPARPGFTIAYATRSIDEETVTRFMSRLARALGQRGLRLRWNRPISLGTVEHRTTRPDEPFGWDVVARWRLPQRRMAPPAVRFIA